MENKENGLQVQKRTLPKLNDIYEDRALISKQSELISLLNAPPKQSWINHHPFISTKDANNNTIPYQYLTIQTIEYLLTSIFLKWRVEIKDTKLIANSVVVVVRLYVQDPITMEWDYQDGVGASPIQTDKDAGAIEFNKMKSGSIQMSAPAAESYAVKDAAEKFGKIFGKDLNRKDSYDIMQVMESKLDVPSYEQLQYIDSLLRNSTLDEPQKFDTEKRIEGGITVKQASDLINMLKINQLNPLTETSRYNQTDIKKNGHEIIKEYK